MRPNPKMWAAGLALCLGLAPGVGLPQVVDCVLAEVDHQVITLSDIRILDAFGIMDADRPGTMSLSPRAILERVIDQKVVIAVAQGEFSVTPEKVVSALGDLRTNLPSGAFEERLTEFGLQAEDLEPYLEEELLYREIIDQRFGRSVAVTLNEIETYYEQTYVPAQKQQGLEPESLVQVLNEIEAAIRNEKIAAQVRTWIDGLRRQAEVVMKSDCLKILEEEK